MGWAEADHTHFLLLVVIIKCTFMVPAIVIGQIIVDHVAIVAPSNSQDPTSAVDLSHYVTGNICHGGPREVAVMGPRV